MPTKCLGVYKIKYEVLGTWDSLKSLQDSPPTYFPHLSSAMYAFAPYTQATLALTIHTHTALRALVHSEPLA